MCNRFLGHLLPIGHYIVSAEEKKIEYHTVFKTRRKITSPLSRLHHSVQIEGPERALGFPQRKLKRNAIKKNRKTEKQNITIYV